MNIRFSLEQTGQIQAYAKETKKNKNGMEVNQYSQSWQPATDCPLRENYSLDTGSHKRSREI